MATILIADDDHALAATLQAAVEAEGHRALWVQDGAACLDTIQSTGADMLIVSASLPVFDGFTLSSMLRRDPDVPPTLPIILVIGVETDAKRVTEAGITAVLPRRTYSLELRDLLAKHLGVKAAPEGE